MMTFDDLVLEGNHVRLEPLHARHKQGLCGAISDGNLWELWVTIIPHPDQIDNFYLRAEKERVEGSGLTFVTIDKSTGEIAGSTRFMKADHAHRRVEIGYSFLGKRWQKTRINTEAKYLMLKHAFELLQVNRVELLTDFLNEISRKAILRLGAKEEGVLRSHMIMPDGRIRDSVIYSIVKKEWVQIEQQLFDKLI